MLFGTSFTICKSDALLLAKDSNKETRRKLAKRMKDSFLSKIPNVKPMPMWVSTTLFAGLAFVGLSIGATIATYVFFGIATLAGLIAIAESNKYVRWFITKSNKFLDLLIFGVTIYATAMLGVTVGAALVFAGLGYTLVYAPWLRNREELSKLNTILA